MPYVKKSLKWQITWVFMGLTVLLLALSYMFNSFFMERFFISQSKIQLINVHKTAKELLKYVHENPYGNGFLILGKGEEIYFDLVKKCSANNISIYLFDADGDIVFITGGTQSEKDAIELYNRLNNSNNKNKYKILDEDPEYIMQLYKDTKIKTDYIELIGNYDKNYMFIMRTDLNAIKQHAILSNQFICYAILLILPVSFILIQYISFKITNPIARLSEISEQMINLDFDAKYELNFDNEIGRLGKNVNKLSGVLETTISDLKTANASLMRDIEQKEENEKKISEFVANVSHELKTPIALIQGYAEGLKEFIEDDDLSSREFYCDVIMDEAQRMNRMLKQLINLNYLELAYGKTQMQRFDIVALIKDIVHSYEYTFSQKNIILNIKVKDDVKNVWADQLKIEEVITNYLTNAIDYVKNENIIEITIRKECDNARIEIFNSGDCIPKDDIDKIWDKFFKVDKARNRQFGGSGIGLSIVKAIMNLHNKNYGAINYKNGVIFFFELDLA